MKTWIFAQPEATGSNGWAGKAIVAGLDITSVDRAPAFYVEDAKLIASAPALQEENEQLKLHIDELKSVLKESAADAEALRALSFGLYERIQGKPEWVVASVTQTAMNYMDYMNRLNGDWVALAGNLMQKIHDLQHTGSSPLCQQPTCKKFYEMTTPLKRKDEVGNPWAPNKDYPGKPVDICICPRCGLRAHDGSCDTGK